jgi:hypothetical protein
LWSFERRVLDWRVRRLYAGTDGHYAAQAPRPRVAVFDDDFEAADPAVEFLRAQARSARDLRLWLARHAIEAVVTRDPAVARVAAGIGVPVFGDRVANGGQVA